MNFSQRVGHFLLLTLFRAIAILPKKAQKGIAYIVYIVLAKLIKYRKKVIISNLINSFPTKSILEINKLAMCYYRNLAFMMIENATLRFADPRKITQYLTFNNTGIIEHLRMQNRDILAVVGHIGNWEYGSMFAEYFNYRSCAIYKKINNPIFDKIYYDLRKNLGSKPVEMHHVLRGIADFKKKNDPFILFLVADQSPMRSEISHWLTFMNQATGVYLGPEKLAIKFDMPVIYLELIRTDFGKFDLNVEWIAEDPNTSAEYDIINRFYKTLEKSIIKYPEQWLWSHRRWKHSKPE